MMGKKKKKKKRQQAIEDAIFEALELVREEAKPPSEKESAATTMGILTAGRALHDAHDNERDCASHHEALARMIQQAIQHPQSAALVIHNLAYLASATLTEEEIREMALQAAIYRD